MSVVCKTVWTAVVEGRLTFGARPQGERAGDDAPTEARVEDDTSAKERGGDAASTEGRGGSGFVVTNDAEALCGLAPEGSVIAAGELYRFAFPASGAETPAQMFAEQGAAPN